MLLHIFCVLIIIHDTLNITSYPSPSIKIWGISLLSSH